MYQVLDNFDDVLVRHEGLLVQLAKKWSGGTEESFEDVLSLIQTAAWRAWKDQCKQADESGKSPYAFGTYMTYHIMSTKRDLYKEFDIGKESKPLKTFQAHDHPDFEYIDNKDELDFIFKHLEDRESDILKMRFLENRTLKECGEVYEITPERVRQIINEQSRSISSQLQ